MTSDLGPSWVAPADVDRPASLDHPTSTVSVPRGEGALTILPAVDVAGGRAAQVVDGGSDDPEEMIDRWVGQGARWVHLVDLDRAFGRGHNDELIVDLVAGCPVPVQLSGGLGEAETVDRALATGATRVVLASAVLGDPQLLRRLVDRYGDRVVPALDVRDGEVVSRGTTVTLGPVTDVLRANPVLRTVPRVLVADASRDGSRVGADLDLFSSVARLVEGEVIASGGVATLDDLRALRGLPSPGVSGVVLGAALYHGTFSLAAAREVAGEQGGVAP